MSQPRFRRAAKGSVWPLQVFVWSEGEREKASNGPLAIRLPLEDVHPSFPGHVLLSPILRRERPE